MAAPRRSTLDTVPLFHPDSLVVATARELLMTHGQRADGACPRCDEPSPCHVASRALQVFEAAGVSTLPEAAAVPNGRHAQKVREAA